METLVLPEIFGVSPVFWVPGVILLLVVLLVWLFIRRRRIYFDHIKDFTPSARKIIEQAKQIQEVVSGEDVKPALLLQLILFSNIGQAKVVFPEGTSKENLYQVLTRPRPWFLRWLEGPRAREVYQKACELAFWELTKVVRQEKAGAIRKNDRGENFAFAPVEKLFEAILEKDGWLGGRLGILGRHLYPGWSFVTWLIWGRSSARFDELARAVREHYLKEAPKEGLVHARPLDRFGTNLVKEAREGRLNPVVGRQKIIESCFRVFNQTTQNSVLLVSEAGVGKTAIAEGVAWWIVEGKAPQDFRNRPVVQLNTLKLSQQRKVPGALEKVLEDLIEEAGRTGAIIFVDEVHVLAQLLSIMLELMKESMGRGRISLIGATSKDEYERYIESNQALVRRFEVHRINEPEDKELDEILRVQCRRLDSVHKVRFTREALLAAKRLAQGGSIPDERLPSSAVRILEATASFVSQELERVKREHRITADDVAQALHDMRPGLPLSRIRGKLGLHGGYIPTPEDIERALSMYIVGQEEAVCAVSRRVVTGLQGLSPEESVLATFIFAGPTGVGKTELVRALARVAFESPEAMLRLDMSEYQEKHTVARLVGAPPGYVGYYEGGQLTDWVRANPYSVVLWDEVEKAHPAVFRMFLQLLSAGRITDGRGRTIDCRNTIHIMTTNAAAEKIQELMGDMEGMRRAVLEELSRIFPPELMGRFAAYSRSMQVFRPLTQQEMIRIVEMQVAKRFEGTLTVSLTDRARDAILQLGYQKELGFRPLMGVIEEMVDDLAAYWSRTGGIDFRKRKALTVGHSGQEFTFH